MRERSQGESFPMMGSWVGAETKGWNQEFFLTDCIWSCWCNPWKKIETSLSGGCKFNTYRDEQHEGEKVCK